MRNAQNMQTAPTHAAATTVVPFKSQIDSAWRGASYFRQSEIFYDFFMRVRVPEGSSIRAGFDVPARNVRPDTTIVYNRGTFFTLHQGKVAPQEVRTPVPNFYFRDALDSAIATVYTFAQDYYQYSVSRFSEDNDVFTDSETPVQWNVTGDGIGGFFGASVASRTFKYSAPLNISAGNWSN